MTSKNKQPVITLRGFKNLERASIDSTCFEATVVVDDKKFCLASDDGWGGETHYEAFDGYRNKLYGRIFEVAKRFNPNVVEKYDDKPKTDTVPWDDFEEWHAQQMIDGVVTGQEVFDHYVGEAISNELYKVDLKKAMSRRVVWLDRGDSCIYQTKSVKAATRNRWIPQVEEREAGRGKDIVILNNLPIDEAVTLYRNSAS